jgi:general stress protein CsbA
MGKIIIINALIWAAILLIASYFFKGHEYYDLFFGIWVIGFTLVNGFLSHTKQKGMKS